MPNTPYDTLRELEDMYTRIKPLVAKMKSRYPDRVYIDGFEPVLTNDVAKIVLKVMKAHDLALREAIEEKIAKIHETDREAFGYELLEGNHCCPGDDAAYAYEKALTDVLALLSSNKE